MPNVLGYNICQIVGDSIKSLLIYEVLKLKLPLINYQDPEIVKADKLVEYDFENIYFEYNYIEDIINYFDKSIMFLDFFREKITDLFIKIRLEIYNLVIEKKFDIKGIIFYPLIEWAGCENSLIRDGEFHARLMRSGNIGSSKNIIRFDVKCSFLLVKRDNKEKENE